MEQIIRAVERAKVERLPLAAPELAAAGDAAAPRLRSAEAPTPPVTLRCDRRALEANRVIAHEPRHPQAMGFDLLRTRVLQHLHASRQSSLIVTAPSAGCGKTVTAVNLALSLARQSEAAVVLIDLDLRQPRIAASLGVTPEAELADVLAGLCPLERALFGIDIAGPGLQVLATRTADAQPAETLASSGMRKLVATLRARTPQPIIIFDMPPLLYTDDVITFMPQADAVLVAAAAGESRAKDIETALRSIPEEKFLVVVLTKADARIEDGNHLY